MFNFKKTLLINSIIASVLPIITIVSCNIDTEIVNSDTQVVKNAKVALEKLTNDQKTVDLTNDANQKLPSEIRPIIKSIKALNALIKGVIVVPNGITYTPQVIKTNDAKGEITVEIEIKKGDIIETVNFTIAGFTTTSQNQVRANAEETFTKIELVERWKIYIEDSFKYQNDLMKKWVGVEITTTNDKMKDLGIKEVKFYLNAIFKNIQSCLVKTKELFSKSNFFEKLDRLELLNIWSRIIATFNEIPKELETLFLKFENTKLTNVKNIKKTVFDYAKKTTSSLMVDVLRMEKILSKYKIELPYKNKLPNQIIKI